MKITKTFSMKAMAVKDNTLEGIANVSGVLDRGADVVFPGFFGPVLKQYLIDGFHALGHNWTDLPIAMPTSAKEIGNQVFCAFEYHSHPMAQSARTVAKERMDKGLSVGLSVGFATKAGGTEIFKSGQKMLVRAKELGCDLSLFDTQGIAAHDGACRALLPGGCEALYEVSMVSVPMCAQAVATAAKSPITANQREAGRLYQQFLQGQAQRAYAANNARLARLKCEDRLRRPEQLAQIREQIAVLEGARDAAAERLQAAEDARTRLFYQRYRSG